MIQCPLAFLSKYFQCHTSEIFPFPCFFSPSLPHFVSKNKGLFLKASPPFYFWRILLFQFFNPHLVQVYCKFNNIFSSSHGNDILNSLTANWDLNYCLKLIICYRNSTLNVPVPFHEVISYGSELNIILSFS
jgi:hypothetical protein